MRCMQRVKRNSYVKDHNIGKMGQKGTTEEFLGSKEKNSAPLQFKKDARRALLSKASLLR